MIDKYEIKAIFCSGLDKKVPQLIKEIFQRGDEIAFHSYSHNIRYSMPFEKIFIDIKRAKITFEDIIGEIVI